MVRAGTPLLAHHVLEAAEHRGRHDAQEKGHHVEDGGEPEQVVELHHVLAATHLRVFVIAARQLHTAAPWRGSGEGRRCLGRSLNICTLPVYTKQS